MRPTEIADRSESRTTRTNRYDGAMLEEFDNRGESCHTNESNLSRLRQNAE